MSRTRVETANGAARGIGRRSGRYLASAFVTVGALTVGLSGLSYYITGELRDALKLSAHSYDVVRSLERLRAAALDHETGARGYALSGDPLFLAPERAADATLPVELETLRALTAENPVQQQSLDEMVALLDAKRYFDDRLIAARDEQGLSRAAEMVRSRDGLRLMSAFLDLTGRMRVEEERLMAERNASVAVHERRAMQTMLLLLAAALSMLGVGYWTVRQALIERQRAILRVDAARVAAERVVNGVPEPLLVLDRSLTLLSANRAYYALFATTPAACVGTEIAALLPETRRIAALRARLADVLADDIVLHEFPLDGEVGGRGMRHLQLNARRLEESGERSVLLAIEDVTDRRRVEQLEVERRALEATNRELQEFAYVASHDLQEPLRKMRAFSERLTARADQIPSDARDYLDRIARGAERMQRLIDDLLAFSRVTTKAAPFVRVDLSAVAAEVVSDLEPRLQASGGTLEVGPLPTIDADATQMRQLLQNLLVNALKFHRPDVPPVVRLSARVDGGRCEIEVADNGIGFDEKYLDRIFTIFQRLHGRNEYEGTGLGLAICRKIVERHRGQITARSAAGAGATFVVNLPLRQRGLREAA